MYKYSQFLLLLLDSTTSTSSATTPCQEAHAAWANLISSNWSLCTIEVLMDPNNNRMQMWMKTTRGTLTPRNEQRVSFKTHCADTGPKRADLPRGDRNEFPAARLPCTLMKPERRSPFGGESTPPSSPVLLAQCQNRECARRSGFGESGGTH